jgi:hypothetical protein
MNIAIITIIPMLFVVVTIGFTSWKVKNIQEAKRFNVDTLPNDCPQWTPMSGLNQMANRKLNRMYKGEQL